VRHRAKLVHLRTSLRCHVHAVLAGQGIMISVSDLFGRAGTKLLTELVLPSVYQLRVQPLRRLIDAFDVEIDMVSKITSARLRQDLGYAAVQTIPGVGPVFAAVFIAEIGDVSRFRGPAQLTSWAGLTPKHYESDTTVHRGRITKQGSRLVRWAAVEAVQRVGKHTYIGGYRDRITARRGPPVQRPSRRMPRRLVRVRLCGQQLRLDQRPGRPPQRRERERRGQHGQRRNDGGSRRRCRARRANMPEYGRCRPSGGYQPELPPRTWPTHALRSPPPKPQRSAGLPRSASAANSQHDFLTPIGSLRAERCSPRRALITGARRRAA